MKKGIHPEYMETKVTCACGNTFTVRIISLNLKSKFVTNAIHFLLVNKEQLRKLVKLRSLIKNMDLLQKLSNWFLFLFKLVQKTGNYLSKILLVFFFFFCDILILDKIERCKNERKNKRIFEKIFDRFYIWSSVCWGSNCVCTNVFSF